MTLCERLTQWWRDYMVLDDDEPMLTSGVIATPDQLRATVAVAEEKKLSKYEEFYHKSVIPLLCNPKRFQNPRLIVAKILVENVPDDDYRAWLQARLSADNPNWIVSVTDGHFRYFRHVYVHFEERKQ